MSELYSDVVFIRILLVSSFRTHYVKVHHKKSLLNYNKPVKGDYNDFNDGKIKEIDDKATFTWVEKCHFDDNDLT